MGYGVGLLGLVAIKVLAPGYYASQDIRTPVKIAIVVLVITQLLNLVLVPWLAHAGWPCPSAWRRWSMPPGCCRLLRRGLQAGAGLGQPLMQVTAAAILLAVLLLWAAHF
jgi:putative peptidoglycan lipid II flippase